MMSELLVQPSIDALLLDWRARTSRLMLALMLGLSSALILVFVDSLTFTSALVSVVIVIVQAILVVWRGAWPWLRHTVILSVFAYAGVLGLYSGRDPGAAVVYLMAGVVMAVVLAGFGWGLAYLVGAAGVFLLGAWAIATNTTLLEEAPEVLSPETMLVGDALSMVAVGLIVIASLGSLVQRLRLALAQREAAARDLERESRDRQAAFEELQQTHASLQTAQASLIEAGKLELLGQLSGGIAHDMNNALTVILGEAGLLLARAPEQAEAISDAVEHASNLTRQLLAIGRREVVQPRAISLGPIVERATTMLRRTLPSNIDIQLALARGVVVHADPTQIQQIILNLGTNAAHAMPEGGTLTIRVALDEDATATLEFVDDGQGIPAELQAQIFEPFFTTKALGFGTGLGLTSVRAIVEALTGRIRCESELGSGTRFVIELPALDPALATGPARDRDEPTDHRLDGYRILVADDEVRVRAMVTSTLQAAGATVVDVGHAQAAIDLAERARDPFDLLWTDIVMPGGGNTLVEYFAERSPTSPIIVSTGYSDNDTLREAVAHGRYELLSKPFSPHELLTVVTRLLAARAS